MAYLLLQSGSSRLLEQLPASILLLQEPTVLGPSSSDPLTVGEAWSVSVQITSADGSGFTESISGLALSHLQTLALAEVPSLTASLTSTQGLGVGESQGVSSTSTPTSTDVLSLSEFALVTALVSQTEAASLTEANLLSALLTSGQSHLLVEVPSLNATLSDPESLTLTETSYSASGNSIAPKAPSLLGEINSTTRIQGRRGPTTPIQGQSSSTNRLTGTT